MEKIKSLNGYQKAILIVMLAMALIFAVIYPKTISRVGYRYNDAILVPTQENGNTLYSGKIQGQKACFTVSGNTVVFQYGDRIYGPYTMTEDPTAIPKDHEMGRFAVGIEVRERENILFRGGVMDLGDTYWLYSEDGTSDLINVSFMNSDGTEVDENGNPIDKMKPSASTIYALLSNPHLTHKGEAFGWFGAVFLCVLNAISILFADELFRWDLSFRIRNTENAEPSEMAIAGRYMSWTVITILAMVLFIVGLQ